MSKQDSLFYLTQNLPESLKQRASSTKKKRREFFKTIKRSKSGIIDRLFADAHQSIFKQIDCLDCANCCKTVGPKWTDKDISRVSKLFKMNKKEFISEYLIIDEDFDAVLKQLPCAFLQNNNKCLIYNERPKACKDYPHTDSMKMKNFIKQTSKNCECCPAVFAMVEKISSN